MVEVSVVVSERTVGISNSAVEITTIGDVLFETTGKRFIELEEDIVLETNVWLEVLVMVNSNEGVAKISPPGP